MKRKQYFISTQDGKVAVTGYPVVIPGYEEFSFFVHRNYGYYNGRNKPPCFSNKYWSISETKTGMKIPTDSNSGGMYNSTCAGALASATEYFKSLGVEHVLPRLKAAIKTAQAEAAGEQTRRCYR